MSVTDEQKESSRGKRKTTTRTADGRLFVLLKFIVDESKHQRRLQGPVRSYSSQPMRLTQRCGVVERAWREFMRG